MNEGRTFCCGYRRVLCCCQIGCARSRQPPALSSHGAAARAARRARAIGMRILLSGIARRASLCCADMTRNSGISGESGGGGGGEA